MPGPEIRIPPSQEFHSLGPRKLLITGYLRMWFAAHFSDASLIEYKGLRSYIWNVNPQPPTRIVVEDVLRWLPSVTEQRPAILVKAGAWRPVRWGIDDRMQGEQTPDGSRYYECGAIGTHTIFGLSANPAEAELLGGEIYRDLLQFRPLIQDELCLKRLEIYEWGELFKVQEATQNYGSPVTIVYTADEQWKLYPHSPFASSFRLEDLVP